MIYLTGEINDELVETLESSDLEGQTVYLNSHGGAADAMVLIMDHLANAKLKELVACGEICSAAFYIFQTYKGKKRILPLTEGMIHQMYRVIPMSASGNYKPADAKHYERTNKDSTDYTNGLIADLPLTEEELELFNSGGDVFFSYTRLVELLTPKPKKR